MGEIQLLLVTSTSHVTDQEAQALTDHGYSRDQSGWFFYVGWRRSRRVARNCPEKPRPICRDSLRRASTAATMCCSIETPRRSPEFRRTTGKKIAPHGVGRQVRRRADGARIRPKNISGFLEVAAPAPPFFLSKNANRASLSRCLFSHWEYLDRMRTKRAGLLYFFRPIRSVTTVQALRCSRASRVPLLAAVAGRPAWTAVLRREGCPPWAIPPTPREDTTMTMLYVRDGGEYREASAQDIFERAQALMAQRFRAGAPVLSSPSKTREFLRLRLGVLDYEVFSALFLSSRHRLIEYVELFRGTIDGASVHPREIVKEALSRNAAAVVIAHGHPSGDPSPSRADELVTQRLKEALSLVDIRLLDHLIVGQTVVSMAELGLM